LIPSGKEEILKRIHPMAPRMERKRLISLLPAISLKACGWNLLRKEKIYQAEYHLLTQEIEVKDNLVIVHLHNPVQDTLLATLKSDLLTFLRRNLTIVPFN
jgi:hypothetical protein